MRRTNRAINRTLLTFIGLIVATGGALVTAAAFLPSVADAWAATGTSLLDQSYALLGTAALPGPARSWWVVAGVGGLLLAAGLCVAWIVSQGGGRTRRVAQEDDGGRGNTVIDIGLIATAVREATATNQLLGATRVSAWEVRGGSGLVLRLQARPGAPLDALAWTAEDLVNGLDACLGHHIPVLVRITSGARSATARRSTVQ